MKNNINPKLLFLINAFTSIKYLVTDNQAASLHAFMIRSLGQCLITEFTEGEIPALNTYIANVQYPI